MGVELRIVVRRRLWILPFLDVGGPGTTDHVFDVTRERVILACTMLVTASLHRDVPFSQDAAPSELANTRLTAIPR